MKPVLDELGVQIIALSTDTIDEVRYLRTQLGITYPMLSDAERTVSQRYGVFNLLGDGVAAPSIFVIDADGIVQWRYVGEHYSDRPDKELVLDAVRALFE